MADFKGCGGSVVALATNNAHKVREISEMLAERFSGFKTMKELGVEVDVVEDADTFFGNALKKAKEISVITGLPALADDSGLVVEALNGAPGVRSARYAGESQDDNGNIELLLKNMDGEKNRKAYFVTVLVIYYPNGEVFTAEGRAYGEILREMRGTAGFGYDPVFYSEDIKKTFSEASAEEKNAVSHRGRALRKLLEMLK